MWGWLLRQVLALLLIVGIGRWLVRRRLGKFGVVELFFVNAVGDLAAHLAFETQHSLLMGAGSLLIFGLAVAGVELLAARYGWFRHLLHRQPERLVVGGQANTAALARARMSLEELQAELRKKGVQSLSQVQEVTLEPEGSLSLVKEESVKQELKRLVAALHDLSERMSRT